MSIFAGAPIIVPMPIRSSGDGTPMTLELGLWTIYGGIGLFRSAVVAMEAYDRSTWNGPRCAVYGLAFGLIWPFQFIAGLINGRRTS